MLHSFASCDTQLLNMCQHTVALQDQSVDIHTASMSTCRQPQLRNKHSVEQGVQLQIHFSAMRFQQGFEN